MTAHEHPSDDAQAVLLLCSAVALPPTARELDLSPLKLGEWNELERALSATSLKTPGALLGLDAAELARALALPADEAERLARLLGYAGELSRELEKLREQGLWAIARGGENYPAHLLDTLTDKAPAVLFGAGRLELLRTPGGAVVGSRNIDEAGAAFAQEVGRKAVAAKFPVVSGGARGTDRLAMQAALEAEGVALGALADSLVRTARQPDVREFIEDGRLVLLTPYAPDAGFSVGAAMGRNKLIYGLAEFAVVVSSDHQTGGTWAGAVEALKADWCPVFVRAGADVPRGNSELTKLGAVPLTQEQLAEISGFAEWARNQAFASTPEPELFDFALRDKPR